MALKLDQLIKLANLSGDVKKQALETLPKMNEDQKFRLSQVCWESIVLQLENKARLEYDRMLEQMANGEKEYGPSDFAQLEDKMMSEMLKEIEGLKTEEEIGEVKEEIKKHLPSPNLN